MAEWQTAKLARIDFADMIESLSPEQRAQQSLCEQWTAHGVLAHVTSFVEIGLFSFFGSIAKSRFNFDKASVAMADKLVDQSTEELISKLRAKASQSSPMPMFPEAMTVGDVAIHSQDVRRPLGLQGTPPEAALRMTLDFLTTGKQATQLVNRRSIDGIKLVASDLGWSSGDGPEISGTGEAIMMGLADRPVLGDLSGEGLSRWS